MPKRRIETSVIVLNYNGKRYLRGCFDSLLKQTYQHFEILFVDNASKDGSVDYVQKRYAKAIKAGILRIIALTSNVGFAGGNNVGYRFVNPTATYVVLVNNDVIVHKDWLERLLLPLRECQDIGLVGTGASSTRGEQEVRDLFLKRKVSVTMNLCGDLIQQPTQEKIAKGNVISMFFVSGNGVALRNRSVHRPFDDDYFAYAEDTYLGWLTHLTGKKVAYSLDAQLNHLGGGTKKVTSGSFNRLLDFHGSKNQMMNYLLFYEKKNLVRVFPLFLLTQLGHIVHNPKKIFGKIRAVWWVLTHVRSIQHKRNVVNHLRRVPDKAIIAQMSGQFFDQYSADRLYKPSYRLAVRLLNRLSLFYCRIVGLPVMELHKR